MTQPRQLIGSVFGHRVIRKVLPRSRRRCHCGCGKRATHVGCDGRIALMSGCEMSVRRWVRDGIRARRVRR